MKRSEMIKLIEENVNLFIIDGKISNTDAENLLIHIELTGMLPPEIVNAKYREKYKDYISFACEVASHKAHGSRFTFEEYYLNEWDKE